MQFSPNENVIARWELQCVQVQTCRYKVYPHDQGIFLSGGFRVGEKSASQYAAERRKARPQEITGSPLADAIPRGPGQPCMPPHSLELLEQ